MVVYREYSGTAVQGLDGALTPVADVCGVNVFWCDTSHLSAWWQARNAVLLFKYVAYDETIFKV